MIVHGDLPRAATLLSNLVDAPAYQISFNDVSFALGCVYLAVIANRDGLARPSAVRPGRCRETVKRAPRGPFARNVSHRLCKSTERRYQVWTTFAAVTVTSTSHPGSTSRTTCARVRVGKIGCAFDPK